MYKIIMIDDDDYLIRDYAECLEDLNFNVFITSDIEIILEQIQNHEFDAAVLDIQMSPGRFDSIMASGGKRTGLLLAKRIRNIKPDIPLLALTTSSLPEMIEWFSQNDYVRYFNKRDYTELEFAVALKDYLDFIYEYTSDKEVDYGLAKDKLLGCKTKVNYYDAEYENICKYLDQILKSLEKKDNPSVTRMILNTIEVFSNLTTVTTIPLVIKDLYETIKLFF